MGTCVLVANGARARFLILRSVDTPGAPSGPNLVEVKDLINPESDERGRDLWSNTKTGIGRSPAGQQAHSYDDHRDEHEAEFERRFAKRVAEECRALVRSHNANQLVVAVPPKMLGILRPVLDQTLKQQVTIREVAKDLSTLSPVELHQHLAREKVLPPRQLP